MRLKHQVKQLCEKPKRQEVRAQTTKFDHHMLKQRVGIDTQGWAGDTQLYAFFTDENMFEEIARRMRKALGPRDGRVC